MGYPPWTLKVEEKWLRTYIADNYDKKGGLRGLKDDALDEFLARFPKEQRPEESLLDFEKRYKELPRVRVL